MSDDIHDLLIAEGERWRSQLDADPPLPSLLGRAQADALPRSGHPKRRWTGLAVRAGAALAVTACITLVAVLWATGVLGGSAGSPLASNKPGTVSGSHVSGSLPDASLRPGFPPPFNVSVAGRARGLAETARIAKATVGEPVQITVVIHVHGHQPGRIEALDMIAGTPNAAPGAGSGPMMPPDFVGRRRNQVSATHFHPGIATEGQRLTASFVFPSPGRYPIDVQMSVTYRDPYHERVHADTGQQLGYVDVAN